VRHVSRKKPGLVRRFTTRTLLVLMGLLLGFVVLEVGLQAAAFWVWLGVARTTSEPSGRSQERIVLCLGDSATYGFGASSPEMSYVGQLERLLALSRENGLSATSWRVVNRGWPGRNSAELLQRTPRFLHEAAPDYVIILVGTNNRWSRSEMDRPPPRLDDVSRAGDDLRWEWRLRTLRLLRIVQSGLSALFVPEKPSPVQHRVFLEETPMESDDPASTRPLETHDLHRQLLELQRLTEANEFMDLPTVNRRLRVLRSRVRQANDPYASRLLVQLLHNLMRPLETVDEALRAIEKHGRASEFVLALPAALARLGRRDEALYWADEAVRLGASGGRGAVAYRKRALVRLMRGEHVESFEDALRAFSLDRNRLAMESDLARIRARVSPSRLHNVLAVLDQPWVTADVRNTAHRAWQRLQLKSSQDRFANRLKDDLKRIIDLASAFGAEPLLMTHPNPKREQTLSSLLREAAEESAVPLIDLAPVFAKALEAGRWEDYFIADGHCTDEGYRLMAEEVARMLLSLEASR
jgi:lysophospholipase L1-like esterase